MTPFSIVLYSDAQDHFYEAVSFAGAAVARGEEVLLFLRGPALRAFVHGRWPDPADKEVKEGLERFQALSPHDLLAEIRAKGKARVYACSAWARMLRIDGGETASRVDAVIGLNAFLSQSQGGRILYLG